MRRLITLISAGRNRIVMIRREQPRTENANWVRGPYRTKGWRVLLAVCSDPVTCTVPPSRTSSGRTKPAIPSWMEREVGIAAGSRPGRAERAGGKPGRVAAMRYKRARGNGRRHQAAFRWELY